MGPLQCPSKLMFSSESHVAWGANYVFNIFGVCLHDHALYNENISGMITSNNVS